MRHPGGSRGGQHHAVRRLRQRAELGGGGRPVADPRLVATWNGLPGVTPVAKFKDRKTAISRIWKRIQSLGEPAQPQADKPEPVAAPEKRKAKSRSARMAPGSRCRLAASLHCGCRCAFDRPDRSQHSTDIAVNLDRIGSANHWSTTDLAREIGRAH